MDELRQADLERDPAFAGWEFSVGVDRLPHARRPRTSPPVWLTGEDWTDLRDNVRAWIERRRS
jgi:hypothetical protein